MELTLVGWRGLSGSGGGASIPVGTAGQVLGYGAGGALAAVDLTPIPNWGTLSGKPATFPPSTHGHSVGDVAGLQTALDGKSATDHTHQIGDTAGLQDALDGKAPTSVEADITALEARQNNWIGTQAEYDALPQIQKDDPTITYLVTS